MRFLRQILSEVQRRQLPKPYLVIDNHPVHRAFAVRELYQQFHVLFMPAYSSHLNSQETVWSIFKRRTAFHLQHVRQEIKTQAEFRRHVEEVLEQMKADYDPQRLCKAAREEYSKLLQ